MKIKYNHQIRKTHRYLGLVLGIQFLLWTLGGIYFSWNNIEDVHGDHLLNDKKHVPVGLQLVSPQIVLNEIIGKEPMDSLFSLQLIELLGRPVYQIRFFTSNHGPQSTVEVKIKTQLADATTGHLLPPIDEREAVQIARSSIKGANEIEKTEYLTELGLHHEYRGKPLPVWAITFKDPSGTTAYVSAELGTFQSVRHNQWRVFDFLWMLHTMDYQSRDDFGNILLKAFSIFGLFTIISGFALYFVTSPSIRKRKTR